MEGAQKTKARLLYDPAMPLEYKSRVSINTQDRYCTRMLTVALFTIVKLWNQPRYPTADESIKKMWYVYTTEYHSVIKNEIMSLAEKWMEL
jgi:hypothetical protein